MEIINFFNDNQGFVMCFLTLVYVIATILICVFNHRSAAASIRQTLESQHQFLENNRARVIPRFVTLEGQLYCLAFHNIGKTIAENLVIQISKDWIECLRKTEKNSDVSDTLLKLAKTKIYLIPDDKIMYSVCVLNDGSGDYLKLCEKPLKIQITYTSDGGNYSDCFELPMKGINSISNTSDYVRMETKKINQLNSIANELTEISKRSLQRKEI